MWILFVFVYAILIGFFVVSNKKASEKTEVIVVLALLVTVAFVAICWRLHDALQTSGIDILILFSKSVIVSISWMLEFYSLKHLDTSVAAPLAVTSLLVSVSAGLTIFNETITIIQIIGMIGVVAGVVFINFDKASVKQKTDKKYIFLALLATLFAGTGSVIDKYALTRVTPSQMQFWFLLFTTILLWVYILFLTIKRKQNIIRKTDFKNYWVYISGILLAVADTFLFYSYSFESSKLSLITIIAKTNVVFAMIFGVIMFKEKNVAKRFIYAGIILAGAILISI